MLDGVIGTNKGEVSVPANIKGQKIRCLTSDIWSGTLSAYGASPTPVAYSEVYTALQQGTVDGVVAASASFSDARFYEVIKYISDAGGLITENMRHLIRHGLKHFRMM
ncbi:MAG: TRAP transporter substrate-binding protein DctP [Eubacterium sp.]